MYWAMTMMTSFKQGLVHQTITIPMCFCIMRFWQSDGFFHESSQGIRLWERLTIELIDPLLRSVGRNDH